MSEPSKEEGSMHWWEFYAVRYAMGTVVGAIIFYLLSRSSTAFKPLLFDAEAGATHLNSFDATRLTLLATYGLVYCYVASAPVLVFHAGRFLLELDTSLKMKSKWTLLCLSVPTLTGLITYFLFGPCTAIDRWLYTTTFFLLAFILWLQFVIIVRTLLNNAILYKFYDKLADRRAQAVGGITDSYRHLREHGNSFLIVLLEVLLAVVLYSVGVLVSSSSETIKSPSSAWIFYAATLAIWILPAALVWVIGTMFERRFAESQTKQTRETNAPLKSDVKQT